MSQDQILTTPHTRIRVRFLASNVVRITHAPLEAPSFPPDRAWMEHVFPPNLSDSIENPSPEDGQSLQNEIRFEGFKGRLQALGPDGEAFFREAQPPRMQLKSQKRKVSLDIPKTELRVGVDRVEEGVRLSLAITPDEAFYGWGEWFNAFRRRSGEVQLRIRDAIAMLQEKETYSAIPFFLSSRGYGFLLLNSHTSRWEIDPKRRKMQIEADGPGADYLLIYGPSFKRIIATYTRLSGRPPLLPRWAFGLWVTSYPQVNQKSLLSHIYKHRKEYIPLDAVILDYHWEERFHNFRWRKSLFPDPKGMIATLDKLGARLGLIITPFLNNRNRRSQRFLLNTAAHNIPPGLEDDDERAVREYSQAREKGYLAHENAKWWFGVGGMPDFTNPAAAAWWNALMRPLYDQGVAFFKNDDGEYLPEDAISALGMNGREYHNIYGFYYTKALFEGMAAVAGRPLVYARSAWIGSQRYPALFLGDQKPTYEGIKSTMRAGLNLSLLGFAYWTADVFGLDGKTTPEMHMRYAQWALLSPIARYFFRPPKIDNTRFPWSHGPAAEANFRKYTELRYRLLPYMLTLAWEAYQTGLPIMRPLVLEYQEDARLAGIYDQVLLGKNLMICPVVESKATSRKIALPEGVWYDFWSGQMWEGPDQIEYQAPLDTLPILVRGGSILPMGPVIQNIPDDHHLDSLQLRIYPPYPAEGYLYDDDGRTSAYKAGAYSLTRFTVEQDKNYMYLKISPLEGDFPEQAPTRHIEILLRLQFPPRLVRVNDQVMDDWQHQYKAGVTVIPVEAPSRSETIVQIVADM